MNRGNQHSPKIMRHISLDFYCTYCVYIYSQMIRQRGRCQTIIRNMWILVWWLFRAVQHTQSPGRQNWRVLGGLSHNMQTPRTNRRVGRCGWRFTSSGLKSVSCLWADSSPAHLGSNDCDQHYCGVFVGPWRAISWLYKQRRAHFTLH